MNALFLLVALLPLVFLLNCPLGNGQYLKNDLKASGVVPVNPAQTNVYQEHIGKVIAAAQHRSRRQYLRNDLKSSGAVPVNPAQTNVYQEHTGKAASGH